VKIRPLQERVIVRRIEEEEKTKGGILLQIEKVGGWRKFVGMSTAFNIKLRTR
jgi:hypothetical protein